MLWTPLDPSGSLWTSWLRLADRDGDGALDAGEFALAAALAERRRQVGRCGLVGGHRVLGLMVIKFILVLGVWGLIGGSVSILVAGHLGCFESELSDAAIFSRMRH